MTMTPSLISPLAEAQDRGTPGSLSQDTASLLRSRHSELTERWALSLHTQAGSNYALRPLDEIREKCDGCLEAYEILLAQGDSGPLWGVMDQICRLRASLQFPPSEIADALMLFLDAADELLSAEVTDLQAWKGHIADLRQCTRAALKAFANSYWIHLELAQATI
jgi:hypothetical protein